MERNQKVKKVTVQPCAIEWADTAIKATLLRRPVKDGGAKLTLRGGDSAPPSAHIWSIYVQESEIMRDSYDRTGKNVGRRTL